MGATDDIDDLAMLAEFAQLAMARARAASARAEAVEAEGGDPIAHLVAMDRMGRAMRLALSLRRRFAGEAQERAGRQTQARKEQLKAALTPAIRLHAHFKDHLELDWALAHRLETEADSLAALPFAEGVARLCQMLGLPAEAAEAPAPQDEAQPHGQGPEPPQSASPTAPPGGEQLKANLADLLTPELMARAHAIAAQATGPP